MNITWVTSEAYPFAKTGGLADVSYSLPSTLADRGHSVSVIMPYYPQKMAKHRLEFDNKYAMVKVPMGGGYNEWAAILEHKVKKNLTFYFIEFNKYFDRPGLYDFGGHEFMDNPIRFIFMCRAAMETVKLLKLKPDILHTNDWHAALCCVYLNSYLYWDDPNFKNCRSILTIHNIGYQGLFNKGNMIHTGLPWDFFNYQCLECNDQINLLKGGIMTAHMVNTVSPTYASEILSPAYSFGLDGALRHRANHGRYRGILNGIDDQEWNPEKDKLIPHIFTKDMIAGKALCKEALQKEFRLPLMPDVPLFGIISRLAYQKGLDVFADGLEDMLYHDDSQFVIIGAGEPGLEYRLNDLANRYPHKCGIYIGFASDRLSHMLESGADFFVMPSRYEPCGLNQMYSLRYGTLPIVRATGGLVDTVRNYSPETLDISTGFLFHDLYPYALNSTIRWAASTYRDRKRDFRRMQHNAMSADYSWNRTAQEYEQMYADAHK